MINYEQATPTRYEKTIYRSYTEAFWAGIFRSAGLPASFEPGGFQLSNGIRTVPDFHLHGPNRYVQIKNGNVELDDVNKINSLARHLGRCTALIDGALATHRDTMVYLFDGREPKPGSHRDDGPAERYAARYFGVRKAAAAIAYLTIPDAGEQRVRVWSDGSINGRAKSLPGDLRMSEPVTPAEKLALEEKLRNFSYAVLETPAHGAVPARLSVPDAQELVLDPFAPTDAY